jgi:N-acetylglucosaminyldiphosphoundecaprenol N-acetyl-beta-D-mannosaminyltransferase
MSHQIITDNRQSVLGYPVDLVDEAAAISTIRNAWASNSGMHVITLNAEMIIAAQKDEILDRIIRQANLVIADGAGVVFALKLRGKNISRLPGIELAQLALFHAAEKNIPVSLIGGTDEVLERLRNVLPDAYPDLKLVAYCNGYFQAAEEQSVIKTISDSSARLVLVAMGVPRQEYFIDLCRKSLPNAVFIGVGGSFDIWSGKKNRAPAIFRNCNLEWLYRLISEPSRYKRMGSALPVFAWQVLVDFFKSKNV